MKYSFRLPDLFFWNYPRLGWFPIRPQNAIFNTVSAGSFRGQFRVFVGSVLAFVYAILQIYYRIIREQTVMKRIRIILYHRFVIIQGRTRATSLWV